MGLDFLRIARHQHLRLRIENNSIPSHASVMRQAAAPAASKTRVAGEKPLRAMLSRLTLRTAVALQLNAL
jgi:hypothetical protein